MGGSINRANWEARVPIHTAPGGYDLDAFDDPAYLSAVVRYDLPRLGRLDGLDVIHQCHIGTDTVSLARLGARSVSGVDFSFTESDVYDAHHAPGNARFDLVYTGIGALCWLPSAARWAAVVAGLLRPGSPLFIREGHPVLWSLCDPRPDGLLVVEFPYFETGGTCSSRT